MDWSNLANRKPVNSRAAWGTRAHGEPAPKKRKPTTAEVERAILVRDLGLRFKLETEQWLERDEDGCAYLVEPAVIASLLLSKRTRCPTGANAKGILADCWKTFRALGTEQRELWLQRAMFHFKAALHDYRKVVSRAMKTRQSPSELSRKKISELTEMQKSERDASTQSMIRKLDLRFSDEVERWLVREKDEKIQISQPREIAALLLLSEERRTSGQAGRRKIDTGLRQLDSLDPTAQSAWLKEGGEIFRRCIRQFRHEVKLGWKKFKKIH